MFQNESNKAAATFLTVVACMVFFLITTAITFGVYGSEGVQVVLLITGAMVVIVVIAGLIMLIQLVGSYQSNRTVQNFIAAQQSNDDSDVAKFGALREIYRGQREENGHRAKADLYDTQRVHRLAEQRAKLLMAPGEPEANNDWATDDDEIDAEYEVFD